MEEVRTTRRNLVMPAAKLSLIIDLTLSLAKLRFLALETTNLMWGKMTVHGFQAFLSSRRYHLVALLMLPSSLTIRVQTFVLTGRVVSITPRNKKLLDFVM